MAGADTSIPLGNFTLRGEVACFIDKSFANKTLTDSERHQEVQFLAGLEWTKNSWTINSQYFGDWLRGNLDTITQKEYTQKATFRIAYALDKANLDFSMFSIVNLEDYDSVTQGQIKYDFTDAIHFALSCKLFNGGIEDGQYGLYKDLSCIIIKGTYRF